MVLHSNAFIWLIAILCYEISFVDAGISSRQIDEPGYARNRTGLFNTAEKGFQKSTKMFYDEYCPNKDSDLYRTEFNCISYCWWNGFQGGKCTETNFCLCDWEGLLHELYIPSRNFPEKPNIEAVKSEHHDGKDIRIKTEYNKTFGASTSIKTQNQTQTKKKFKISENISNMFPYNNVIKEKNKLSESSTNHSKIQNCNENSEKKHNRNDTVTQTNKKHEVKKGTIANNNQRYSRKKNVNNKSMCNKNDTTDVNHKVGQINRNINITKACNTEKSKESLIDSRNKTKVENGETNTKRKTVGNRTTNDNTTAYLNSNNSTSKGNTTIENSNKSRKIYNEIHNTNIKYNKTKEPIKNELAKIREVLKYKTSTDETPNKIKRPKIPSENKKKGDKD